MTQCYNVLVQLDSGWTLKVCSGRQNLYDGETSFVLKSLWLSEIKAGENLLDSRLMLESLYILYIKF